MSSFLDGHGEIIMTARSTVIVSPRERYSPTIESLQSLFASVPASVPVIVVDGAYPADLRAQLRELQKTRRFRHETRDWPLLPNEARNIGTDLVETEFIVFSDNDIIYEPGWLEALEAHADRTGVEVVAPVICVGPPKASIIHQAGGQILVRIDNLGVHLSESHNLVNRSFADLEKANLPDVTDTGEFHCIFARTDFMKRIGHLDERLMTREHNDFALRTRHAGGRIGFEPKSVVTYNAKTKLQPGDLDYHVFRWNHQDAVGSLDAFEEVWGVFVQRRKVLRGISNRRRYRIVEQYADMKRWGGKYFVTNVVAPIVERYILKKMKKRPGTRRLPHPIPAEESKAIMAQLASRPKQGTWHKAA